MKLKGFIPTMAAIAATLIVQGVASAHYIWATVDKGRARFALLENPGAEPSAAFAKYVAGLTPRYNGKTVSLGEVQNGARFATLPDEPGVVEAESVVGVTDRNGETYLLVYNAKGAASLAAAGTRGTGPADLSAQRVGDTLVVSVRQNGAPVPPQTEVWVQWPGDENPSSALTDDKGEARAKWPNVAAAKHPGGFVGVRALVTEAKAGERDGKAYPSIHRWATLTFPVAHSKTSVTTKK